METVTTQGTDTQPPYSSIKRNILFAAAIVLILGAAIVRSSIATSLDSFTFDEAYHIGAGAAYVKTRDFRLNPEQPPLTKLWVGAYVTALGYELSPYRSYADKSDERDFVENDAYFSNDPDLLQYRARTAMFGLSTLFVLLFSAAAWRAFGPIVSVAATLFLAIDPTVAAHMPVVMTDLPVALTSAAALLFAGIGFRTWRPVDLVLASLSLGLALGAKQSAVLTFIAIGLVGLALALIFSREGITRRLKRFVAVGAVMAGSLLVLWGLYFFQFYESRGTTEETFNRTLAEKITDVRSPIYRFTLTTANDLRLLPRAYIWGMADTIRAGVDGRAIPILAFGEMYYTRAPFYYFPGAIAAKLPIGLLLLTLIGALVFALRRLPNEYYFQIFTYAVFTAILLFFLIRGSSYAGVRHALALFPLCAVFAGFAVHYFVTVRSKPLLIGASLCAIGAMVSAVPVMRPWEYFNEFAGGTEGAYKYFSDEGVDLGLRLKEIAAYNDENLKPSGELPFLLYFSSYAEKKRRGIDYVGRDSVRDAERLASETLTGTFIAGGPELSPKLWWDVAAPLRDAEPIARMGNVFVFRGTFVRSPAAIARSLYFRAMYRHLYVPQPDVQTAIELLERSAKFDSSAFQVSLELGNQYLKLGRREDALRSYRIAYENAPKTDGVYDLLEEQLHRFESGEPLENITPLRNPGVE